MGGGYLSYTLAVCTATATIVLCLNPIHYSFFALIAMFSEICFNYQFLGKDFVVALYYGVDAFLIFLVTSCLNFFFSLLRYTISLKLKIVCKSLEFIILPLWERLIRFKTFFDISIVMEFSQ